MERHGAAGQSTQWVGPPTAWGLERVRNVLLPLALLNYLRDRGWGPTQATMRVVEGSGHNERGGSARVESVLQFLLG